MKPFKFKTVLKRPEGVGTWTYLDFPFDVAEAFGSKTQAKVKGTINKHPFRGTAMPHGDGTHYMVVNKSIRDATGASEGSAVSVVVEQDLDARTVTVPTDFKRALNKNAAAKERFAQFPYSHKKEYVEYITSAKQSETRARRITQAIEMMKQGATPKRRKK